MEVQISKALPEQAPPALDLAVLNKKAFASKITWDPALLSLNNRKRYYIKQPHFDSLISQAKELGIVDLEYSAIPRAGRDEFLHLMTEVLVLLESHLDDTTSAVTLPQPTEHEFAEQAAIAKQLQILSAAQGLEKHKNMKILTLLRILILRSKQQFDVTRNYHCLARGKFEAEMRNMFLIRGSPKEEHNPSLDKTAMEACAQNISELDASVRNKLEGFLADLDKYEAYLKSAEIQISDLASKEVKYLRDAQYANVLATLIAPFNFFSLPPEVRNLIYKELFEFTEAIIVITSGSNPESGERMPWTHPLLRVSRQFRDEAGSVFYGMNTFGCKSFYDIECDFGTMMLAPEFSRRIKTLTVSWTSLGNFESDATQALKYLPVLNALNIYVCWNRFRIRWSTQLGPRIFRFLLSLRSRVEVNVFSVEYSAVDQLVDSLCSISQKERGQKLSSVSGFVQLCKDETINQRLFVFRDPASQRPVDENTLPGHSSLEKRFLNPKPMTLDELDLKLNGAYLQEIDRSVGNE